ncbi:zinc transporter ZIP4-like isoform X2 [Ostrea edulis]|nr:zinc transporter ZIP4-like isoform X2 [Ostrea edulis]XP_048747504.1 zinc transporter ZIP4-like isoform X2 [Ostrea edulis]
MPSETEVYGYGTLANLICCLCSLAGAFTIPFAKRHKTAYNVVLSVFMGLAVGALASDAILHLVPEALGLHHHGPSPLSNDSHSRSHDSHHHRKRDTHQPEDSHHHHHGNHVNHDHDHPEDKHTHVDPDARHIEKEIHVEPYVWYCMVILLGTYIFYLVEMAMVHVQRKSEGGQTPVILTSFNNQPVDAIIKDGEELRTSREKNAISPLVVMIVVGDALHNFTDGLAIAASFSASLLEGIAITIAILCHELPQELGDFAILINEGLSFKRALIANLFSSLTAFIGFYIGVPISSHFGAGPWIFSITAGMFIYIALVDMLPSLIKNGSTNTRTFVYHNIGILFGALVIILLSVFESKIEIGH